jgi:hypothetical protein
MTTSPPTVTELRACPERLKPSWNEPRASCAVARLFAAQCEVAHGCRLGMGSTGSRGSPRSRQLSLAASVSVAVFPPRTGSNAPLTQSTPER